MTRPTPKRAPRATAAPQSAKRAPLRIAIIGGGIGGLTLALCLERAGFAPRIFERSSEIREVGVGINTLPHAIRVLAELGLLDALDAVAIRTKELIYKTATGQNILRQPRGTWAGYEVPQFSIHRGMLQKVLHDAVVDRLGPEAVTTDRRLTRFTQKGGKVTAVFSGSDGVEETVVADALIGADGIHSTVRSALVGEQGPPQWSGIAMWRGATWTKPFLDGQTMVIAGGLSSKLVLYPIHNSADRVGETLMNWVICAQLAKPGAPMTLVDDWSKPGALEDVMPHVTGKIRIDELDVERLITSTPEFYVYPMADRDPLPRWSQGRVTLLGDAAHPMYPVGSNGASQAILDAEDLAQRFAAGAGKGVAAGLKAYDGERRPATAEIVTANRKGGPERVIDLVETRAPDGFTDLSDVATAEELTQIVGAYQSMAGFATEQVNRSA